MSVNDPIADMLTRIRNACMARHTTVQVPASKMKLAIAQILKREGFIREFAVKSSEPFDIIEISLKYTSDRRSVITGLKRVSKPGLRVYAGRDKLPRVLRGLGIAILSTSQGLMTDRQARKLGIGGEVLAYVW